MTQEETQVIKELLLKDLCARLPYGVIGQCEIDASYDTPFETKLQTHKFNAEVYGLLEEGLLFVTPLIEDQDVQEFANEEVANGIDILDFKPYLFPLSTISNRTLEMIDEWSDVKTSYATMEIFNSRHIDYRGLIEKGLAIDATGLNIY